MLKEKRELVLCELRTAMERIDEGEFEGLIEDLLALGRILLMGVGRVQIALRAWVKRMVHLGLDINFVGSETEKPVGPGDLLIVASSSGESVFPAAIATLARDKGARVLYIGCSPDSAVGKVAHGRLLLAGRTKFACSGEFPSAQPMSTLFEQQLFLLGDMAALAIMERQHLEEADIKSRHANLE